MWCIDEQYWPGPKVGTVHRVKLSPDHYISGSLLRHGAYSTTGEPFSIIGDILEIETYMFGDNAGEKFIHYITRD
jgi:hypothetical protein